MSMSRRSFFRTAGGAAVAASVPQVAAAASPVATVVDSTLPVLTKVAGALGFDVTRVFNGLVVLDGHDSNTYTQFVDLVDDGSLKSLWAKGKGDSDIAWILRQRIAWNMDDTSYVGDNLDLVTEAFGQKAVERYQSVVKLVEAYPKACHFNLTTQCYDTPNIYTCESISDVRFESMVELIKKQDTNKKVSKAYQVWREKYDYYGADHQHCKVEIDLDNVEAVETVVSNDYDDYDYSEYDKAIARPSEPAELVLWSSGPRVVVEEVLGADFGFVLLRPTLKW